MASKKTEDVPLRVVQLDGHVVLKVIKHCSEHQPSLVTGQLLGLDVGSTLEVTDCFPFPGRSDEEEMDNDTASYQLDMMRCLREVNVDNNTVGWYQSTVIGSFQTEDLIQTFISYQESIKRCIALIYDPQLAETGDLPLRAIKLKDSFISAYKADKVLGSETVKKGNLTWKDVFEDLPIQIHNSALVTALMASIEPAGGMQQKDLDKLNLSVVPLFEKNLDFLNECLDDLVNEQQKVSYYHRNVARQQQQQAQWLQKRRQENAQRRATGEEPLPEEDPVQFKPIPEPGALENYLITNQIANYCGSLSSFSAQSLQKLQLMEGLQRVHM
ncbi:hypothetical protein WJX72_008134 [[Myrmecia] bisecta]|uniref:Eukaryotic translation initiation factor 3 subunit H n=1 Tax=[Myrmecia] bisecta TaxID=41462 RepID=A0AAW1PPF5_9CHLO